MTNTSDVALLRLLMQSQRPPNIQLREANSVGDGVAQGVNNALNILLQRRQFGQLNDLIEAQQGQEAAQQEQQLQVFLNAGLSPDQAAIAVMDPVFGRNQLATIQENSAQQAQIQQDMQLFMERGFSPEDAEFLAMSQHRNRKLPGVDQILEAQDREAQQARIREILGGDLSVLNEQPLTNAQRLQLGLEGVKASDSIDEQLRQDKARIKGEQAKGASEFFQLGLDGRRLDNQGKALNNRLKNKRLTAPAKTNDDDEGFITGGTSAFIQPDAPKPKKQGISFKDLKNKFFGG